MNPPEIQSNIQLCGSIATCSTKAMKVEFSKTSRWQVSPALILAHIIIALVFALTLFLLIKYGDAADWAQCASAFAPAFVIVFLALRK